MRIQSLLIVPLAIAAMALGACSSTLVYKPEYVTAGVSAPVVTGKAVLVMDKAARSEVFSGGPQSLTGGATSISTPIGAVIDNIGEKVCTPYFSDGVTTSEVPAAGVYSISVEPQGFSYKYDQLSNLGFAITPKVTVALKVGVRGPNGTEAVPVKRYERTDFSASGAYVVSFSPAEKINESMHMAIADIFREVMGQLPKTAEARH